MSTPKKAAVKKPVKPRELWLTRDLGSGARYNLWLTEKPHFVGAWGQWDSETCENYSFCQRNFERLFRHLKMKPGGIRMVRIHAEFIG